jgi:hypothetical protein
MSLEIYRTLVIRDIHLIIKGWMLLGKEQKSEHYLQFEKQILDALAQAKKTKRNDGLSGVTTVPGGYAVKTKLATYGFSFKCIEQLRYQLVSDLREVQHMMLSAQRNLTL